MAQREPGRRSPALCRPPLFLLIRGLAANALWDALNERNQAFSKVLLNLSLLHAEQPEQYAVVVKYLASLQSVQVSDINTSSKILFTTTEHLIVVACPP